MSLYLLYIRFYHLYQYIVLLLLVQQSLLGRLLGYGTITIQGTGASIETLRNMADPIGLRSAITAR